MLDLSIGEVTRIVDGRLFLGAMPPLGGTSEPAGRIVSNLNDVKRGDVFWPIEPAASQAGECAAAFVRGAVGVVSDRATIEPWAGAFRLHVRNAAAALAELAGHQRTRFAGEMLCIGGLDAPLAAQAIHAVLKDSLRGAISQSFSSEPIRPLSNSHAAVLLELAQLDSTLDYFIVPEQPNNAHDRAAKTPRRATGEPVSNDVAGAKAAGQFESSALRREIGEGSGVHATEISRDFFSEVEISVLSRPSIAVINTARIGRQSASDYESQATSNRSLRSLTGDCRILLHGDAETCRQARRIVRRVSTVGDGAEDLSARRVTNQPGRLLFTVDGQVYSVRGAERRHLIAALFAIGVARWLEVATGDVVRRLAEWPADGTASKTADETPEKRIQSTDSINHVA